VIWDGSGAARRRNIAAHELGGLVIETAFGACPALPVLAGLAR
jgi:hypothetical protein